MDSRKLKQKEVEEKEKAWFQATSGVAGSQEVKELSLEERIEQKITHHQDRVRQLLILQQRLRDSRAEGILREIQQELSWIG